MKISALNSFSAINNHGHAGNNKTQNLNQNINEPKQNKSLLDYPKNYRPSFGIIPEILYIVGCYATAGAIAVALEKYDAHLDKVLAKQREEEINRAAEEITKDIQKLANKHNLSFKEAKIYHDNYLKTAMIEPKGDGNEIGLNAVMGYSQQKYRLAVDFITPLVAIEKDIKTNGGRVPNGLLLYGPTGTGKTYIAEKTCEHLRHFGVNVVNLTLKPDDHEENAEQITDTFEKAKESYKETGKYTVINFTQDIDLFLKNRNLSPETIPEVRAFLYSAENCAKEGVTWIGTAINPKELDSAVIRAGRTDIKMPIGNMKDYVAADILRYTLLKHGEAPSADELDYKKVIDTMKEYNLIFTPAVYDGLIKSAQKEKLHPKQIIDADMILDAMFEKSQYVGENLNPNAIAKFKSDKKYMESTDASNTEFISQIKPKDVKEDAAEKLGYK